MARPPHPDRHPHRRGARDARGAAERGRVVGRGRRPQHRRADPVGRTDRRHPRQPSDISRDQDAFAFDAAEPIQAKGKAEPVEVWEVVGCARTAPSAAAGEMPLVGRDAELDELVTFCESVSQDRCAGLAAILGTPGIGKSRLLLELVQRLEERFDVHWGRCLSYGEGITYWPVDGDLQVGGGNPAERRPRDEAPRSSTPSSRARHAEDLDELRTIAAALSNLIGIPTTPRGTYSTSEISQAELHWGIRRVLQLLAAEADRDRRRGPALGRADAARADLVRPRRRGRGAARADLHGAAGARGRRAGLSRPEGRRRTVDLQTLGPEAGRCPPDAISQATPPSPRRRSPRR